MMFDSDGNRSGHVAMVGMADPYRGDADEVWAVNRSYLQQADVKGKLSRIYSMHPSKIISAEMLAELSEFPESVRIISQSSDGYPAHTETFPYDDVVSFNHGVEYFTCSTAYMLAQAYMEGWAKITMSGMYYQTESAEYMMDKPCVEMWIGIGIGAGVEFSFPRESGLAKAWAWSTNKYSYIRNVHEHLSTTTMAAAYRASMTFPIKIVSEIDADGRLLQYMKVKERILISDQAVDVAAKREAADVG